MKKLKPLNTQNLIKVFKKIADCSRQIKMFAFGQTWQTNSQPGLDYPLLYLEIPQVYSWRARNPVNKKIRFAFQVMAPYLEGQDSQTVNAATLTSVGSDLTKIENIVEEVIAALETTIPGNLLPNYEYTAIPFTAQYEDTCYGLRVEVEFISDYGISTCDFEIINEAGCLIE
jgi:hypothetical protein